MHEAISYLLSANLLLCIVVIYYRVLLARQSRFQLNRVFLLGGTVLSFSLPLLRVVPSSAEWAGAGVVRTLPEVIVRAGSQSAVGSSPGMGWMDWSEAIYLLVAACLAGFLLFRVAKLVLRIALAKKERKQGFTLVHGITVNGPASFFGFLLWDDGLDQDDEGAKVILAHERCHIRQWHSLDLLWAEILTTACWFNPTVYLLRRDLRQCHEFLADEAAAEVGGKEALFREVLKRQFGTHDFTLANHFQSQIKARITMLNLKSGHKALVRYLMILPLVGLMVACTSVEQDTAPEGGPEAINTSNLSTVPPPPPPGEDSPGDDESRSGDEASLETLPMGTNAMRRKDKGDHGPNDLELLDVEPKPLNMIEVARTIEYPEVAKEAEITGKVVMRVKVGTDGSIEDHQVIKEVHPMLREAVEEKLYDLKFEPGVKDGKKVKAWVTIPFKFEL